MNREDLIEVSMEDELWFKESDANAVMDSYEKRIKELEAEVDAVKMNSGYVAFMEAQARIKELEDSKIELLEKEDTQIAQLVAENAQQKSYIKELEEKLALTAELIDGAKEHLNRLEGRIK